MDNKRRVDQLSSVRDPQKVKVLILTQQKTTYADFYFIVKFVNVVKLDLSYNKLTTFPNGFSFKCFPILKTLFLHYNKFNAIKSLQATCDCKVLEYLTLFGNPLEEAKTRHYFVNQIQSLKLMDDKIVRMEERNQEICYQSSYETTRLSFPIVTVLESQGSAYFLSAVIAELYLIRKKFIEANPIIKIQRFYRKKLKNRRIKKYIETVQLEADQNEKIEVRDRLVTQKMEIRKSNEEKITSIFKMNFDFFSVLKNHAEGNLYASKNYCEKNGISYSTLNGVLCLRQPNQQSQKLALNGKSHIQLIIKASQGFLIRKKGSNNSSNFEQKYNSLRFLLQKKLKRNKKLAKFIKNSQLNKELALKIKEIELYQQNQLVLITENPAQKFKLLKDSYAQAVHNKSYFPFCLQQIKERTAAAVSIQRLWRGYNSRKSINSFQKILQNQSARMIQRWVRNLGFYHRGNYFMDVRSYLKKQSNSRIIICFDDILKLEQRQKQTWLSVNFSFPDQKCHPVVIFGNVKLFQCEKLLYPAYMGQLVNIETVEKREVEEKQDLKIVDILFKGATQVKYHQISQNLQSVSPRKSPKSSLPPHFLTHKKIVIFEYQSQQQAKNRKFILSLISYSFQKRSFIKSQNITFSKCQQQSASMTNRVKNLFMISDKIFKSEIKERAMINMKIKLFFNNEDHSRKFVIYCPETQNKKQEKKEKEKETEVKSNIVSNIWKNNIELEKEFGWGWDEKRNRGLSYREFEERVQEKYRYFVAESEERELQKCQSLQPSARKHLQKQLHLQRQKQHNATEINKRQIYHIDMSTLKLNQKAGIKQHFPQYQQTQQPLEPQQLLALKKQKIEQLKKSHLQKIEQNQKNRMQQLTKIKNTTNDEAFLNSQKIQSEKLELLMINARRHNRIRQTIGQNKSNAAEFEKDFLKKGNSSIRRKMLDFESEKNSCVSRSPENQSIYDSQNSLSIKNSLSLRKNIERERKKNNLKTQIREFSIKISDADIDMSIGGFEIDNFVDQQKLAIFKKEKRQLKEGSPKQSHRYSSANRSFGKKKLFHSVFPEELYPLKEGSNMGFQLPKIKKN